MREIKFRGKRPFIGGWIYGLLDIQGNDVEIFSRDNDTFKKGVVAPETIGQFTGLYDKNGVEIFEGDVIQVLKDNDNGIFEIKWIDFATAFGIIEKVDDIERSRLIQKEVMLESVIIGNIHDNPELLEQ